MDSLSQILLGASTAAVVAPPGYRRRALLIGAVLGTLPDLDVLIDYGDAVSNMTYHRGFSHSLFFLAGLSAALWCLLVWRWKAAREQRWRWLAMLALPLLTHPLLDSFTVYGTQLFWPLATPPVMGGNLFIIDPLYTLPLLFGVLFATLTRVNARAHRALRAALGVSCAYIGWSLFAQLHVERIAAHTLADTVHADAPRLVVATPFNTLLWRIVVQTPEGYLEGSYSLWADHGPIRFEAHRFDRSLLEQAGELWAVQRLLWFSQGFLRADLVGDELVLSDLRMGQHPSFFFTHAVGRLQGERWIASDNRQLPVERVQEGQFLALWRRIWRGQTNAD